jgi:hypothetical protein
MRDKLIFGAVFLCSCIPVLSQDIQIEQKMANEFIDDFFWYQKYLPLEYISEYYTLRNLLDSLRTNDPEEFDLASKALYERILYLYNLANGRIREEIERKRPRLDVLNSQYGSSAGVPELVRRFSDFTGDINNGNYPQDDTLLDQIEEYYSRLIIRLGFRGGNESEPYDVIKGDYFRKIARKRYGNKYERDWIHIYNANINNKKLLPNPANPDLIYPGVRIVIPPLRIPE